MAANRGLTPFTSRLIEERDVLVLIDGEHYPPVVRWALTNVEEVAREVSGLVFLGGREKVKGRGGSIEAAYDLPVYSGEDLGSLPLEEIKAACLELVPDMVLDLSDEPVVNYEDRFRIASVLGQLGLPYCGADFCFNPPSRDLELEHKSIGILGTGKRVGKTGVSVTLTNLISKSGGEPIIVSMGRGGPPEPEIIESHREGSPVDRLLEAARAGRHAASDCWEDALLTGVTTIGCRRCGGGMAGQPVISNVKDGAILADELGGDPIIFEGSGSTIPPVATDRDLLVVGGEQKPEHVLGYFGGYRVRRADVVLITMAEEPTATRCKIDRIKRGVREINPDVEVAETVFRPEVFGEVRGRKVFLATTAAEDGLRRIEEELIANYHVQVTGRSNNLSNKLALRKDLSSGLRDADVLLTEIKAGSVSVAVESALEHGLDIAFLHNRIKVTGGTVNNLSQVLEHLVS